MAVENRPSTRPRMASLSKPVMRRYNTQAIEVAKLLHATGHEPGRSVLDTLRTIDRRHPYLSFADFISGSSPALVMAEASSAERGHA